MHIKKRNLKILIENYLKEDSGDDWLGDVDKTDIDIDLGPNTESEKKSNKIKAMSNLSKNGAKDFYKEYEEKIKGQIKPLGTQVKEYFKSDKFTSILKKPLYAESLKKENIDSEKFVNDIVTQIENSSVNIRNAYKKNSETLGFLIYKSSDEKLHKKNEKKLNFLNDAAVKYGDRLKSKPVVFVFIENIFQAVAAHENEAYWYKLDREFLFEKAYDQILKTIKHEFFHIGNLHQIDLLSNNQDKNSIFDKISKYFLKKENLFKNEKRNKQTAASDKSNTPVEARRKDIQDTLTDYLNVKSGFGTIEIMERIQKLKSENKLLLAMQEWKDFKIDYETGASKYEQEILDLFCIINWDDFKVNDIVKDFNDIAKNKKSASANIA